MSIAVVIAARHLAKPRQLIVPLIRCQDLLTERLFVLQVARFDVWDILTLAI